MRKRLIILCLFYMAFSSRTDAQSRLISPVDSFSCFTHHTPLHFFHNLSITQTQPVIKVMPLIQQAPVSEIKSGSIADMPFFCAMECRLWARTGVWLKLRTGDDASYEKLIRSTEK